MSQIWLILVVLLVIVFVASIIVLNVLPQNPQAERYEVDQGQDVVLAVDQALKQGASSMYFPSGQWSGDGQRDVVLVSPDQSHFYLQGQGPSQTIIAHNIIIDAQDSSVTLRDLQIRVTQGPAIELRSGNLVLDNCRIYSESGIEVSGSTQCLVDRVYLEGATSLGSVLPGGSLVVRDSRLRGDRSGLSVQEGMLTLERSMLIGHGTSDSLGSAINVQGTSHVSLKATHIVHWPMGIDQRGGVLEAQQVWMNDVTDGIHLAKTSVLLFDHVNIQAEKTGLVGKGNMTSSWLWRDVAVAGQQPVDGDLTIAVNSRLSQAPSHLWQDIPEPSASH